MISRRAILIEAARSKHGYLPGAEADVRNTHMLLLSDIGGAWRSDEIVVLSSPKRSRVDEELRKAQSVGYALVSFSGHGQHVIGYGYSETQICLNDNEDMLVRDLNPGNDRCFVIADSCRKVTIVEGGRIQLKDLQASYEMRKRYGFRERFDEAVSEAEKGCIFAYSCSQDEAAGESDNGGYFSR